MDSTTQEELQRILRLHPQNLTAEEQEFLIARRWALTQEQRNKYRDALGKYADDDGYVAEQPLQDAPVVPAGAQIDPLNPNADTSGRVDDGEVGNDPYDPDATESKKKK